jgi:hypothetical protein
MSMKRIDLAKISLFNRDTKSQKRSPWGCLLSSPCLKAGDSRGFLLTREPVSAVTVRAIF